MLTSCFADVVDSLVLLLLLLILYCYHPWRLYGGDYSCYSFLLLFLLFNRYYRLLLLFAFLFLLLQSFFRLLFRYGLVHIVIDLFHFDSSSLEVLVLDVLVVVLDVLLVNCFDVTWGAEVFRSCLVLCYFVFFFTNYGAVNDFLNYLFLFLCFIYLRFCVSFLLFDLFDRCVMIDLIIVVVYCHLGQYNW